MLKLLHCSENFTDLVLVDGITVKISSDKETTCKSLEFWIGRKRRRQERIM